jgi:hypothetical protein
VYAVSPTPVKSRIVAGARARIGSAPHQPSTAATASTPVTTHSVTVWTVPTASAEPEMPSASSQRLAWAIQGGRRSGDSVIGGARSRAWGTGQNTPRPSVAEGVCGVRKGRPSLGRKGTSLSSDGVKSVRDGGVVS